MEKQKSNSMGIENTLGELLERIVIVTGQFLLFNAQIIWQGIIRISGYDRILLALSSIGLVSVVLVHYNLHLSFLNWIMPETFDYGVLVSIHGFGKIQNYLGVTLIGVALWLWAVGLISKLRNRKYQVALDKALIKTPWGTGPKIVDVYKLDPHRTQIKVDATYFGCHVFESKRDALQSAFESKIEKIETFENPKYVKITLNSKVLSKHFDFEEAIEGFSRKEAFLIGDSEKGFLSAKIANLPHVLISGTTGGGKSQFFKQMLVGLLKTSPYTRMCLIDLKGGLEFREFSRLPNVKIAKDIETSVTLLSKVKKEMEARFRYLEKRGLTQIDPSIHPFDRIVIGVDEASVLYAQIRKEAFDYELVLEARELTESIAKLGRAAGIHLVLATQKVSKNSIDTRIQENITGRMCFKLNTTEGSVRVLGHGKAAHLPAIPGRGIWQSGTDEYVVQTPFISTTSLKRQIELINEEFSHGERGVKQKEAPQKENTLPLIKSKSTDSKESLHE